VLNVAYEGTVLYTNEAGEPLLHFWGTNAGEKLPPHIEDFMKKVISQNIPEKMEVKVGKIVYLVEFHPIPEEECVNIYGFDISDRKELEGKLREAYENLQVQNKKLQAQSEEIYEANEALHESEERFHTMANTIPQLAWIAHPDGYIYWYNERWYAYTGTTPEQMEGWGWQNVHDPEVLPKVLEQWKASIAAGQMFDMEFPLRGADGIFRPFLTRVFPLKDAQGNILQWFGTNTDVTERKQMEDKLKQSVKQYQTLGDTIPYGVWITDAEGYCTYASDSFLELLGLSLEQVQKFGWMDRLPPEDVQPTTDHWLHCVQTGEDFEHEHRFRAKDGSYRNVLAIGRPVRNDAGRITEWVGLNLDVTERRKMEEALKKAHDTLEEKVKERTKELEKAYNSLKESEKSLTEAQRIAHLGSWDWNIVTNGLYWSDEIYRIFGRSSQEFGATYDAFLNYIHPADQEYVNNAVVEALNGKSYSIDHRVILADGEERIVHEQGEVTFDENNTPVRMKGTVQDITERKQAEEKLQEAVREKCLILDNINASIAFHDIDNCFVWANKFYLESIGKHTSELKGRKCHDCWGLDRLCLNCPVIEAMRTDQPQEGEMTPENQPHWPRDQGSWLVRAAPVKNANGKIIGAIEVAHDITERKKAEEALEKIEIVRKQEIHHRIKNNLQVISSLLDLQAEKFNGKECIRDSEVLEAFRNSQDRVISMALIHEELYKGGGFETLNFSSYIEELTESLLQSYSIGNIDISLNIDLVENAFFDMDNAIPLGIIVNELVSNSFKHAFPGRDKGEIQIKLQREEGEDCSSTFVLSVSDNGVGIPENLDIEDLESLGLQLVTSLVDQLDGELELKRNNGTEFTISFTVPESNNLESA